MSVQPHHQHDVVYSRVVQRMRVLTAAEVAELTGVSERQVHRWAVGASKPEAAARERLLEISYIVESLREIYSDEGVEIFLHGRNRMLSGRRPIDLLRDGEYDEVLALIDDLNEGVM